MKLLNKRTLRISKSVLLFNLLIVSTGAFSITKGLPSEEVISQDRYLMKIVDRTLSFQDVEYQLRNITGLKCVYGDPFVVEYFGESFIKELKNFVRLFPSETGKARKFMHDQESFLKQLRYFFKMLRYSEDQKSKVNSQLAGLIRQNAKANKCNLEILHEDSLKSNFVALLQLEIYLRTRYGGQLKSAKNFDEIRPSIDLFVESLDKQFSHEYYW
jgi:hydroxymethylpyrimidine pyrophosphatase-like HAD family hydrolase